LNARSAFLLFFAGFVCSLAGCTKPIVVGERYVLSAATLAASDEENAMFLNKATDDKESQNKYPLLQDSNPSICGFTPSDAIAFLGAGTVVRVLRVHDGKVGRVVFVEVIHDPSGGYDLPDCSGHRYWIKAQRALFKRIDEWYPGYPD
jgi:hypothetical protein